MNFKGEFLKKVRNKTNNYNIPQCLFCNKENVLK